jgi:HEXXH motif-containing protein
MLDGLLDIGKEIRAVQSRRLQHAVMSITRDRCARDIAFLADEFTHPKQALKALQVLLAMSDGSAANLMRHPAFNFWTRAVRRRVDPADLDRRARYADELQSLVWAASCCEFSERFRWNVVADYRGGVRAPPLGCHLELGDEWSGRTLTLESDGECVHVLDGVTRLGTLTVGESSTGVTLVTHGGQVRVRCAPRLFADACEVSSRDPWLRVRFTGTNQRRTGTDFHAVDDCAYHSERRHEQLESAANLITEVWPEVAEDISIFTAVIVPFWRDPPDHSSFSVGSRQGAIYVSEGDLQLVAEMLIHENAHVKMRQMQALDGLLIDPRDDTTRIQVPWRPDPRPLPGVFEGMFVFVHISEFCIRLAKIRPEARQRARELADSLRMVFAEFSGRAKLTREGQNFLGEMSNWIEDIDSRC